MSIALTRLCDSVCSHDNTKTAETKIVKLGTEILHHLATLPHLPINIRSKGQRSRSQAAGYVESETILGIIIRDGLRDNVQLLRIMQTNITECDRSSGQRKCYTYSRVLMPLVLLLILKHAR